MFYVKRTINEGAVINYNGIKYSSTFANSLKILKNGTNFITLDSSTYENVFKAIFTAKYIYIIARRQGSYQDILIYNYNGDLQKTINTEENNTIQSCSCDSRSAYIYFYSGNCYEIREQNFISLPGMPSLIIKDNDYCYAMIPSESNTILVYLVDRGLTTDPIQYKELGLLDGIHYYSFPFNNLNVSKPCLSGVDKLISIEKFIQINNDFSYSEEVDVDSNVDISSISSMFGDSGRMNCIEFFADVPNLYSAIKDSDNGIQIYEESSNYNITLKFDNDVVSTYTKTTDTILKAVRISILGGSITARLKYSKGDDDFISTLEYPNSYKYATSVTIGENTYNITDNVVEVSDLNISSDVEIKLNNGVVAYYDITFKNDTQLLQIKRTEENTLPVYEGETPTQEGKVFIGWTPEIYAVDKAQIYQATFEQAPFTITIADSGSNSFGVLWLDTQSTEKTREFSEPITSVRSVASPSPYENTFTLNVLTASANHLCLISYEDRNVIPQQLKIGQATYDIGTNNDITIESNTIITIVANTRYFIRFLNYDNSVLETKYVYSGETPTYTGDTPYQKGYTFTGWSPALYPANKNQDYVAEFSKQTFTIRFLNDDGSELETKQVEYGVTPTYSGTTPTKEGYTFNGWSPVLYPATKNQDYTATYRNSAFALTLYKNSAENNRIDKTEYLTSVGEITGYLRNETNIINPSIVIEYAGVIDFNYVYISTFNRYYFVTNITSVRTNLWRLDMSCDVLMTYKDTILNYECYVSRNENDYNPDIEDNYLPLEYEKVIEVTNLYDDTYNFGKIFLEGNYSVVFTTIYKGTEYEVIDEQIETEFQDLEGNILEVSSISLGASNYKCMGIIKNNILDNLNKLVEKTINDDTLASYIISLIVFPIKGSDLSFSTLNPSKLLIKDDSTSMTVAQDDVSYPRGGVLTPVIANQFTIKPKYNNFLDYEPYTTYEIYLPFYGWLKLNSYQILNEQLVVTYVPQVDSEQCTIIISKGATIGGSKEVIAEVTCQLGIQIPINSTNVERVNREKTANTLNSIVGTISGVAVAGAGAVTGNPLALVGGASMAIGSITSGLSKNMTMLPSAQSKTGSSYDGALGDRIFKLRITYPKIAVDDISKYAKYIGRPLQTNVKLNTLTGYTIVGGVHIENLDTATDNEKTDIENQLRKGVII